MSYKLLKPYTDKQRLEFIVNYNHKLNLRIEETSEAMYALENFEIMQGDKPVEDSEYDKKQRIFIDTQTLQELNEELNNLDLKRIRAICEPEVKNEETGETWLDYYNSQILSLREQIQQLKERMNENDITI